MAADLQCFLLVVYSYQFSPGLPCSMTKDCRSRLFSFRVFVNFSFRLFILAHNSSFDSSAKGVSSSLELSPGRKAFPEYGSLWNMASKRKDRSQRHMWFLPSSVHPGGFIKPEVPVPASPFCYAASVASSQSTHELGKTENFRCHQENVYFNNLNSKYMTSPAVV